MNILADGTRWGAIETTETEREVRFSVHGEPVNEVWRVWGIREGKQPLLIGIPEPQGEEMVLRRSLSKTFLQRCGYWPELPERYVAGVQFDPQQEPPAGIPCGITERNDGANRRLTCPFDPKQEFPLAYAFSVCTVTDGQAELLLDTKTGRPVLLERPEKGTAII